MEEAHQISEGSATPPSSPPPTSLPTTENPKKRSFPLPLVLIGGCGCLFVALAIVGILAAGVLTTVNPQKQFSTARDVQRRADLYGITNAVYMYSQEHNGEMPPGITENPASIGSSQLDLSTVLAPTYLAAMPKDPVNGTDANTMYSIYTQNGKLVAKAISEINPGTDIIVERSHEDLLKNPPGGQLEE